MSGSIKRVKFAPLFESVKPFVLERDNNRCVKCGTSLTLEIHHIEGYEANDPDVLVTLCYLCHGIAPMGKTVFSEWLQSGETGTESLQRHLTSRGITLNAEQVTLFCAALVDMNRDIRKSQMRKARDYMRNSGARCEGQKPFGEKPGELEILNRMIALRSARLTFDAIADSLNANNIPTRKGKLWMGCTIGKILKRNK